MKNKIPNILVGFSKKRQSFVYKILTFLAGLVIFMVLLPAAFFCIGKFLNRWISIPSNRSLELILAFIFGTTGLMIQLWTLWAQWRIGSGGPTPIVPTRKLITAGPYAYCRNPLHFGFLFYCFAFGTFLGNLTIGLVCIVLEVILLLAYIKGIEEKELALRFGKEYLEYKKNTPFLAPKIKKK
jgi:protein-S-isoprenylcysteine O-methyltransferase Ste14